MTLPAINYTAPTFVDNAPPALSAATMNALAQAAQAAHDHLRNLNGAGGTEIAQDSVAAALNAGSHTGITFDYDDQTGALSATVTVAGSGSSYTDEQAQDAAAALLTAASNSGISFAYDDGLGRLTATVNFPTSLSPSGGAGGVLGGTYPNPSFAVDMATQAELDTGLSGKASTSALASGLAGKADATHGHVSTQITDFTEAVQDAVALLLGAGSNVILNYDDAADSLTISATGAGGTGLDAEAVRDAIGVALVGVGNIAVVVNDAADTITITTTATQNSTDAQLRDRDTHTDGDIYKGFTAGEKTKLAGIDVGATAYTDEQAQDAAAALFAAGTHSGISFVYDDTAGKINATASGGGGGSNPVGLTVVDYGADPTGTADSTSAFQAAINAGDVVIPVGTYRVGQVTYEGSGSRRIVAVGRARIVQTAPGGVFALRGGWDSLGAISAYSTQTVNLVTPGESAPVSSNSRATVLTLAAAATMTLGDVVKVVSNDQVPTGRTANARVGEYATVAKGSTGTDVNLDHTLVENYATSPRLARLWNVRFEISGPLVFDTDPAIRDTTVFGAVVLLRACQNAYIGDGVEFHNTLGRAVGNYGYLTTVEGVRFRNLANRPSKAQYGYGIQDGGHGLVMTGCRGENLRHMYSEGANDVTAGSTVFEYFGGGWFASISDCIGTGCASQPFDTHGTAYGVSFSDCRAVNTFAGSSSGGYGFAIRGRNITVNDCVADGGFRGFAAFADGTRLVNCVARNCEWTALDIGGDTSDASTVTTLRRIVVEGGEFETRDTSYCTASLGTPGYSIGIEIKGARFYKIGAPGSPVRMLELDAGVALTVQDVTIDWTRWTGGSVPVIGILAKAAGISVSGRRLLLQHGSVALSSITGITSLVSAGYPTPIDVSDIECRATLAATVIGTVMTDVRYSARQVYGTTAASRPSTADLTLVAAEGATLPVGDKLDPHITVRLTGTGNVTLAAIPTTVLMAGQRITVLNDCTNAVSVGALGSIPAATSASFVFSQGVWRRQTVPAGGGSSYTDEQVRDTMAAALVAGANVTITPDDAADTITISATGGGGGGSASGSGVFGDSSDNAAILDGTATVGWASKSGSTYTMTRDAHCTNLTVASGVQLNCSGCRIFASGTFTNNGVINADGAAGNANGTGGAAGAYGSIIGGVVGSAGNTGAGTAGSNGSYAVVGVGGGGAGGAGSSGAGGNQGFAGFSQTPWMLRSPFPVLAGSVGYSLGVRPISGAPSGGGGGGDGTNKGGGGGAGASAVIILAKTAVNAGTIQARGGAGGTPASGNAGGGGGGGGGLILVYSASAWTNSGSTAVTGGAAGSGVGTGVAGNAGTAGTVTNMVVQ